jgi:hypothetical protein
MIMGVLARVKLQCHLVSLAVYPIPGSPRMLQRPTQLHSLPGVNVIKLFCPQFTNFCSKLECLSSARFLPNLIFASKVEAYLGEALLS